MVLSYRAIEVISKIRVVVNHGKPPVLYCAHGSCGRRQRNSICAGLEARGFRRLFGVEDLLPKLGVSGRPSMLGYVFDETWAKDNPDAIARFLEVTREAKDLLARSDSEWQRIAPLVGARDKASLKVYRDRYREGIPRRSIEAEEADAAVLYRVLAKIGGRELFGAAGELAPGTFYRSERGE